MKNISINNENLNLSKGKKYIVIDALYLDEFTNAKSHSLKQIREDLFPYIDTPFAEYFANNDVFELSKIDKIDYDDILDNDTSIFTTDTGLMLFICEDVLWDFINDYNYEELVNSEIEFLNFSYWEKITSKYDYKNIAILTSFQESKYAFVGSGTYIIKKES